jgi:GT2 family glycosyltransferase
MSKLSNKLTLGITACNRPDKLKNLLKKLKARTEGNKEEIPYNIIIYDATPELNEKVYSNYNADIIEGSLETSPSEARKIICENIETEYLLFLDEDLEPKKCAIEDMLNHIEKEKVEAVSGLWIDHNEFYRPIGDLFIDSENEIGRIPVRYREVQNKDFVSLDVGLPSVMLRTEIFTEIEFDPKFEFYYEWYDFFMQFREKDFELHGLPPALFIHNPGGYEGDHGRDNYEKKMIKRD